MPAPAVLEMERVMTTHTTVVLAAAVVVLARRLRAHAQPVGTTGTWRSPAMKRTASLRAGSITSLVRDASGAPVSGAIVSAVGGRTLAGTTDANGALHARGAARGRVPRPGASRRVWNGEQPGRPRHRWRRRIACGRADSRSAARHQTGLRAPADTRCRLQHRRVAAGRCARCKRGRG